MTSTIAIHIVNILFCLTGLAALILLIDVLILSAKALRIYIRKNSDLK